MKGYWLQLGENHFTFHPPARYKMMIKDNFIIFRLSELSY